MANFIHIHLAPVKGDWTDNIRSVQAHFQKAFTASVNQLQSMLTEKFKEEIESSGGDLASLSGELKVELSTSGLRAVLTTTMPTRPYAGIFETGGTINGNPRLWIPFSNTDAVGVPPREYPGGLFSVGRGHNTKKSRKQNKPLLFSLTDGQPKYFGALSVHMPRKWRLRDAQRSVMANYRHTFSAVYLND